MFCPECGKPLSENQKFCSECGARVLSAAPDAENAPSVNQAEKGSSDFCEFLDQYVRQNTTFTSVRSLISGARPLRFATIITVALCLLGLLVIGPTGIIVGLLVSFLVCRVVVLFLLAMRSARKYTTGGKNVDIHDLAVFLEQNMDSNYFTAWQRGNLTLLGITTPDLLVVEFMFNNKTFHRITFDTSTNGVYKLEPCRATAKERLKDGGDRNPNALYKSDWVVRPILEAAMIYYLNERDQ